MAELQITDEFGLNTTLQLRDNSPLAKAKITHLASVRQALKDEITKPIDQTSLKSFSFGLDGSSPKAAIGDATTVTFGGGVCGGVSIIRPADKTLFPKDGFSPDVTIEPNQCWMGVELDVSLNAGAQAAADGFGAGIKDAAKLGLTTYTLITADNGRFPDFIDGLKQALDGFYLDSTADAIRAQPSGTVCAHELSGTVTFTGSYQLPVSVNALASADLPFNYKISVQPNVTLKVSGSVALSGDLIVRSHKITGTSLDIGIYKKKGSTLTASFTAATGIGVDVGTTDLAALILSTVLPGVESKSAGITGDDAAKLNSALKDCISHSLSVSANASCSAAMTDEAAVIYHLDLSAGNLEATNAALTEALRGDWTRLSQLENAHQLRNIVTDTKEYKHEIAVNLFGLYNAGAVETYVQSCTILCDDLGHVAVTDKMNASRIGVTATPYAADPDKLRTALAQDFLATASYAAVASRVQPTVTIQQSYFLYHHNLPRQRMRDQVLLGTALKLIDDGSEKQFWNEALAANAVFPRAHISASAQYNTARVLSLFFVDPAQHQPRSRAEIERFGRDAMIAVIDPGDPNAQYRLAALQSDTTWNAMDATGSVNAFGTIPELKQLHPDALGAVGSDWTAIRWWADSMLQVAPRLAELLAFLDKITATDFSTNPQFLEETKAFRNILGGFVKKTHAAFADSWGMAVIFLIAGKGANRAIDINWGNAAKHYESKN